MKFFEAVASIFTVASLAAALMDVVWSATGVSSKPLVSYTSVTATFIFSMIIALIFDRVKEQK